MLKIAQPDYQNTAPTNTPNPIPAHDPSFSTISTINRLSRAGAIAISLVLAPLSATQGCAQAHHTFPIEFKANERPQGMNNLPPYQEMYRVLKESVGEEQIGQWLYMQKSYAEKYKGNSGKKVNTTRLSTALQVPQELIDEYTDDVLPTSWTKSGHVESIIIKPGAKSQVYYPGLDKNDENNENIAFTSTSISGEPITITFTLKDLNSEVKITDTTLEKVTKSNIHEFAHAASWNTSPQLSTRQSLTLMYLCNLAIQDPQRPKFTYPEKIKAESKDEVQLARSLKMDEYFAELLQYALSTKLQNVSSWEEWEQAFSEYLQKSHNASKASAQFNSSFIHQYFLYTDPDFKPWIAASKHQTVVEKMHTHHHKAEALKNLEKISDHELRTTLIAALKKQPTNPTKDSLHKEQKSADEKFKSLNDTFWKADHKMTMLIINLKYITKAVIHLRSASKVSASDSPLAPDFSTRIPAGEAKYINRIFGDLPEPTKTKFKKQLVHILSNI